MLKKRALLENLSASPTPGTCLQNHSIDYSGFETLTGTASQANHSTSDQTNASTGMSYTWLRRGGRPPRRSARGRLAERTKFSPLL